MFTYLTQLSFYHMIPVILYFFYRVYIFRNRKPIVITIDGNIGSGKSTFIKILKTYLNDKIYFAKEPVDEWLKLQDDQGTNVLEKFYQDKNRWGYTFQNLAFITRTLEMDQAFKSGKKIIISERSVMTDYNIFAKMLFQDGDISNLEMQIYKYWYNAYNKYDTYSVYIKTNLDNCEKRINIRNRNGETNGISRDYLQKLESLHDDWLLNLNDKEILVINGNKDFKNDTDLQKLLIKQLSEKFGI